MECEKWSNFNNFAFFEVPDQKNVCFDMLPGAFSSFIEKVFSLLSGQGGGG